MQKGQGHAPGAAAPRVRERVRLLLDGEDEIRAARWAHLGPHRPVIAERIAQLEGVELLGEAHAVTDVQARREVAAEDQRGLVRDRVGLEVHVRDADARADLRGEQGRALAEGGIAGILRRLERAPGEDERPDLRLRQRRGGAKETARALPGCPPPCAAPAEGGCVCVAAEHTPGWVSAPGRGRPAAPAYATGGG